MQLVNHITLLVRAHPRLALCGVMRFLSTTDLFMVIDACPSLAIIYSASCHTIFQAILPIYKVLCQSRTFLGMWFSLLRCLFPINIETSSYITFSSVQFSRSVMSNSLQPHESQHARPPCPSPSPRVHSNSRPSSRWCHPAISSCVVPFSFCPQSLPASESSPMGQIFAWGG